MEQEIVDRSMGKTPTVLIELDTGPLYRVPREMSIGEAAAHILTPDTPEPQQDILEKIVEARERALKGNEIPYSILVNGEEAYPDARLPDEKAYLQVNED